MALTCLNRKIMENIVHLNKRLPFRPDAVFKGWTEPRLMRQWLFKSANNDIVIPKYNLTEGGEYSILETTAENEKVDHFGNFITIIPSTRLSFMLEVPWHFQGVTKVEIEFIAIDEKHTLMDFLQTGVRPDIVEANWNEMFSNLDQVLRTGNDH